MSLIEIGERFFTNDHNNVRAKFVVCQCSFCDKIICRKTKKINQASPHCGCLLGVDSYNREKKSPKLDVTCLYCGKIFKKSRSHIKRTPNNYCSRACSAVATNKSQTKRKRTKICKQCDNLILSNRTYCDGCLKSRKDNFTIDEEKTVGEAIYLKHHKSSAFALIRSRARAKCKKIGWSECCVCGYKLHIEIAHIKPITEFSHDSKISEVNDLHNLLPMCPNHHWEFDNDIITIYDIDKGKLEELQNRGIEP